MTDVIGGHVPILIVNANTRFRMYRQVHFGCWQSQALSEIRLIRMCQLLRSLAISRTGLSALAGLLAEIVEKLRNATLEALDSPKIKTRFKENGNASGGLSSEDFTAFVAEELNKWTELTKTANIKLE